MPDRHPKPRLVPVGYTYISTGGFMMKSLRARVSAAVALALSAVLIGVGATPAQAAATPVPITVTADAYATDGSGQITSTNDFLYDSAKGEDATGPNAGYQIAYRGNLDMTSVWSAYSGFRTLWLFLNGRDQARWAAKTFSGTWNISFKVDTSVVSSNPDFVTCDVLQAEIIAQNPGTRFGEFMQCTSVAYDDATGTYSAKFALIDDTNPDGKVTGATLDANQPATLHLTTPPGAFYVKQSAFEAGKTFSMTEPHVDGEMTMDYFYTGMPLTFNDTGDPVNLTMKETHDAVFSFASATPGATLPAEVEALVPPRDTMILDGETVTPPVLTTTSVTVATGVWNFVEWTPAFATMAGADIPFVGTWAFTPNPSYAVTYAFESADGSALPTEVTSLLPANTTAIDGSTVTPTAPASTSVEVTGGTWSFDGWTPASATVAGADVAFVGTWSYAATPSYNVTYAFESADGSTLPTEVIGLLPANTTALDGTTVTPTAPTSTTVAVAGGTWNFDGWAPANATVDGADVAFVGTWTFTKTAVTPSTTPPPSSSSPALPNTGGADMTLLLWIGGGVVVLGLLALVIARLRGRKQ